MKTYLSAREAATLLWISRETLYAYVSRGQLFSEPSPGGTRGKRYRTEDIAQFKRRRNARRAPHEIAEASLNFGFPVLSSGITLIQDGMVYYKGRDALELARTATLEDIAMLLWGADRRDAPVSDESIEELALVNELAKRNTPLALETVQAAIALGSRCNLARHDLRTPSVQRTGWRILDIFRNLVSARFAGPIHTAFQGAPLYLFAAARTVGWIAHTIEQYESRSVIRPRAKYVGPLPA